MTKYEKETQEILPRYIIEDDMLVNMVLIKYEYAAQRAKYRYAGIKTICQMYQNIFQLHCVFNQSSVALVSLLAIKFEKTQIHRKILKKVIGLKYIDEINYILKPK